MATEGLDARTHELLWGIRRSVRYHLHRRRFHEAWHGFTAALCAVVGPAAGLAFLLDLDGGWAWAFAAAAALVGLAGAVDLAAGTARNATLHGELAHRFARLEERFAHGRPLGDDEHAEAVRKRLRIEASEPPPLRLLDALCHYELLAALGYDRKEPQVPWHRRLFMHFLSQARYARSLAREPA